MAGLALGSFYFGRLADKSKNNLRLYAFLELGIAAFALIFPLILSGLDEIHTWLYLQLESTPLCLCAHALSALFSRLAHSYYADGGHPADSDPLCNSAHVAGGLECGDLVCSQYVRSRLRGSGSQLI